MVIANVINKLSSNIMNVNVTNLDEVIKSIALEISNSRASYDAFFILIMSIVVFFMQCGYGLMEAGVVQSKNAVNALFRNFCINQIAAISFFITGFAFGSGEYSNVFLGTSNWAMVNVPENKQLPYWFMMYVYTSLSITIWSGAAAERCSMLAYFVYTVIFAGFVQPVVYHWMWSTTGWLTTGGTFNIYGNFTTVYYKDYAGSSAVFIVSGVAAFVAAGLLGSRSDRKNLKGGKMHRIPGHSLPLIGLGGFIIITGFLALNACGTTQISITDAGNTVGRSMVNTILSGSMGSFIVVVFKLISTKKFSYLDTINGCIAGMVAICAGSDVCQPYGAIVIGTIAAVSFLIWSKFMKILNIDDPLDIVAVNFGGGVWGIIAVAFFHYNDGILYQWTPKSGYYLLWQLAGLGAISGWTAIISLLLFGFLKLCRHNILRVSQEVEDKGLDAHYHDEKAYSQKLNKYDFTGNINSAFNTSTSEGLNAYERASSVRKLPRTDYVNVE